MTSKLYGTKQVQTLLKAIDSYLEQETDIILIGGTAALLAYKATRLTRDIDSFDKISRELQKAYERVKKDTGMDIPFSQAGVADGPHNFEDRLELYNTISLSHLKIWIPEIHDFILMKTMRAYDHDLEVIEEISKRNKVSKAILSQRFKNEMNHVIGRRPHLNLNFAAVLARCFGEKVAEEWAEQNIE